MNPRVCFLHSCRHRLSLEKACCGLLLGQLRSHLHHLQAHWSQRWFLQGNSIKSFFCFFLVESFFDFQKSQTAEQCFAETFCTTRAHLTSSWLKCRPLLDVGIIINDRLVCWPLITSLTSISEKCWPDIYAASSKVYTYVKEPRHMTPSLIQCICIGHKQACSADIMGLGVSEHWGFHLKNDQVGQDDHPPTRQSYLGQWFCDSLNSLTIFFFESLKIMNSVLTSVLANDLLTDLWLPHLDIGLMCWLVCDLSSSSTFFSLHPEPLN